MIQGDTLGIRLLLLAIFLLLLSAQLSATIVGIILLGLAPLCAFAGIVAGDRPSRIIRLPEEHEEEDNGA